MMQPLRSLILKISITLTLATSNITAFADTLGTWRYSNPSYSATVIIENSNGKYAVKTIYSDGSKNTKTLNFRTIGGQERFYEVGNRFGEYYVLNKNGNLDMYDRDGYLFSGIAIK